MLSLNFIVKLFNKNRLIRIFYMDNGVLPENKRLLFSIFSKGGLRFTIRTTGLRVSEQKI